MRKYLSIIVFATLFVVTFFTVLLCADSLDNAKYHGVPRPVVCSKCFVEFKSDICEHCGSEITQTGLMTSKDDVCDNCCKPLSASIGGKCYYCGQLYNCTFDKFKFASLQDYYYAMKVSSITSVVVGAELFCCILSLIWVVISRGKKGTDK